MITKKISPEMASKLLKLLCQDYIAEFGHGVRNLPKFSVLITAHEHYAQRMPELYEYADGVRRPRFLDVMQELQADGFVRFDENIKFFLTEKGYKAGASSWIDKSIDFCNRNQGLAIPIAVLSFIVSIIALFV